MHPVAGFVQRDVDVDACQHQRVTQRDQLGTALGGLDARDAGHGDDVAFPVAAALDQRQRLFRHAHPGLGARLAVCLGFVADIDHAGRALRVEMG